MAKVYEGLNSIDEHFKYMKGWIPHKKRRQKKIESEIKPKQCFEIQRLKRESGLE